MSPHLNAFRAAMASITVTPGGDVPAGDGVRISEAAPPFSS
jgi:hypothetical protein